MKKIIKNQEPQQLSNWKAHGNTSWTQLTRSLKGVIHDALLREQGYICCYCESFVTSSDSHVEHFRPRSVYPAKEVDYQNLHCSCLRQLSRRQQRHCGHGKGNWFDEQRIVSPLQNGCDRRFIFNDQGEIAARNANDLAAKETITRLGLNLPKLISLRAAAVDALQDSPPAQIRALLKRGPDGRFPEYFTTIEDVLL